ncbi:DUF6339 family protein [Marinobacter xiaoshiensis]|uniref:DUF6339 family protein n=1 Tax=Marinobacter xiaoshiensis TaxID=3073652 RepID=A0ABU2HCT1_9GAMM|nr:DUF6339 family protein [Marinobacter sp. F60267]MDS1308890.1 DUF6339 family protein [Marinobacter sp. F60267]
MNVRLFPRLKRIAVDQVLEKLDSNSRGSAFTIASSLPDAVSYAPTGGSKATHSTLVDMRGAILDIARNVGYPNQPDRSGAAIFDVKTSVWLAESEYTNTGEFLRDDVWACIAAVLLPDIVIWRFSLSARERFHGGVRNAFQRLWLRGQILDRGEDHPHRWELLEQLTEDALVQITERPSIASSRPLSIALAEGWLRASKAYGSSKMEELMRKVTLQVRLQNETRHLATLSNDALEGFVDNLFNSAAEALGIKISTN